MARHARGARTFAARIFRRRVAATPRPRRGYSAKASRGDAAAATWIFREEGRGDRRGNSVETGEHHRYYHWHVDRDNTPHYEFSGLLYLSDFGDEFDGGLFSFEDGSSVEPRRGRLSMFGSGAENRHRVAKVTGGRRLTLSFWFACDPDYEFKDFLDGKMRVRFGEEM